MARRSGLSGLRAVVFLSLVSLGIIGQSLTAKNPLPQALQDSAYRIVDGLEGGEYRSAVAQVLFHADDPCQLTRRPELLRRLRSFQEHVTAYVERNSPSVLAVDYAIAKADYDYERSLERVACSPVNEETAAVLVETHEKIFSEAMERLQQLTARWSDHAGRSQLGDSIKYGEAEAIAGAPYRALGSKLLYLLDPACPITEQPALFAQLEQMIDEATAHHRAVAGTPLEIDLAVTRGNLDHARSLIDINCADPDAPDVEQTVAQIGLQVRRILNRMDELAGLGKE